jgi:tetraacyldisaccharide 4'-kinase
MTERPRVEWLWWGTTAAARTARAMLAPVSFAFSAIVRVRNAMYDRGALPVRTPRIPAVSVGNLTVGGTGKTPVASWLAARLQARGAHPAIVLRGYGDDEPLVHARLTPTIPVVANPDRLAAIDAVATAGADVVVMDDGFQHRRVARAADVVLISADASDAPVRMLPTGPYREPARALGRASLVLVTRKAATLDRARAVASWARAAAPGVPSAIVHLALDAVYRANDAPEPVTALSGRRVLAIAGVGNASAFGAQLALAGAIVRLRPFPDHHPFAAADAEALARDLAPEEVALCTLKDAVKLLPLWPREARSIGYVSQAVLVEEGGESIDALLDLLVNSRPRQL